jgi:hypothetical protein
MGIFEIILVVSLSCLGIREVTDGVDDGRIGYPIRKWFIDQEWMPLFFAKPIILCVTCMASFWGTIIYWSITYHFSTNLNFMTDYTVYIKWVFCCLSASFVNTLLWTARNKNIGSFN